jgi:hypothetical protein
MYKLMWEPPVPGEYTIIATFAGSEAYAASYAETSMGVEEAPRAAQAMEPELTSAATAQPAPASTAATEAPFITTETAIIAAVACIIGVVSFLTLRKRK